MLRVQFDRTINNSCQRLLANCYSLVTSSLQRNTTQQQLSLFKDASLAHDDSNSDLSKNGGGPGIHDSDATLPRSEPAATAGEILAALFTTGRAT